MSGLRIWLAGSIICLCNAVGATRALAQVPETFRPSVAILHPEGSNAETIRDRVLLTLWFTAQEMNIPPQELPSIVVIRAQRTIAEQIGIEVGKNGALIVFRTPDGKPSLFELWIVGDDIDLALTKGFIQALSIQHATNEAPQVVAARVSKRRFHYKVRGESATTQAKRTIKQGLALIELGMSIGSPDSKHCLLKQSVVDWMLPAIIVDLD